jgi:2-methylcitrate dehydratase PrpD
MGTTQKLVKFVMDTDYRDIPPEVIATAKDLVLDCLGAMVFGYREEASQKVIRYVKAAGGTPEVSVVGAGFRTSLENAAFANGTLTHSAELEAVGVFGIQPQAFGNPQSIIAAALSVGEQLHLSGDKVIAAIILGHEFQARFSRGCLAPIYRGFCPLPLHGAPSIAAMASKMMGLSEMQARMAVGASMSFSSGFFRQMGTMLHYIEAGIASRSGVTAALLAKEGITADPDLIEGPQGFCELFSPGEYDLEIMTQDLGNPYLIHSPGVNMKAHSCCAAQHVSIDTLLKVMADNGVGYGQVERLQVYVPRHTANLLHPEMESSPHPKDGAETRFSLHHAHAVALADGTSSFQAFSDSAANDPRYVEARDKVDILVRDDIHEGWMELKLKDGRSIEGRRNILPSGVKGGPENPFTKDELVARHENLCRDMLAPKEIQRSIDLVLNFEKMSDVTELMDLASFGGLRASA